MTAFVYDPRMVPFLWPSLRPCNPDNLVYDRPCLVPLTTGRVPLYPFSVDKAVFLFPFSTSTCQINLKDREAVIDFVTNSFLVKTNKDMRKKLLTLSDEDFFQTLKLAIALKKWRLPEHEDAKVYKLFEDLMDSRTKAAATLFTLLEEGKTMPEIWASILTFLNRVDQVKEGDTENLSDYYRTMLDRASKTLSGWRPKVLPLLTLSEVSDIHLATVAFSLRR
jgi:hypothetical protein